jgi:uncharacterized protein involved in response to NO
MSLHTIDDAVPAPRPGPAHWALWSLGFRPFYLLAAGCAALSVPLWALQFAGWLPYAALRGPLWHAHEMLFGFTLAVLVGFLFTAGRNWSGQPTPSGRTLQALAALWLAGRLLVLGPWPLAAMAANVAFPLAAAFYLGRALVGGGNRRNYFFVGLLALLGLLAAGLHASQLGWLALPGPAAVQAALSVVLLIMAIMAGRVVPMFTNNGVPGADARRQPLLESAALGSVLLLLGLDLLALTGWLAPAPLLAATAAVAAVTHGARLALWQPWATRRVPLVWALHLAYAWLVLHLLLRAGAAAGWLPSGLAVHALTVGAIGLLTLAMMTRTARGHTGRPLVADRWDVLGYLLLAGAAVLRCLVPLMWPQALLLATLASALAWTAAWTLYALHYGPWLCRARADGRPG